MCTGSREKGSGVFYCIDRALVEANRKLIEIFEAKIKAKLDEIWGEEKSETSRREVQGT